MHAQVAQDLRPDAVGAQDFRTALRASRASRRLIDGLTASMRSRGVSSGRRMHDDAPAFLRDSLHRRAQRPTERCRRRTPTTSRKRILQMHAHERCACDVELAANEREMHRAIDVILVADTCGTAPNSVSIGCSAMRSTERSFSSR